MKRLFPIAVVCCALVAGASGCGGDDSATSQSSDGSATTKSSAATGEGDKAKPAEGPLKTPPSKVVLGDYKQEGPFAAISGREGNKKPLFEPSGQPAPKQAVTRELEVGSGPTAQRGDEVSIYYAGADHDTGKIRYYGWPPFKPATFRLGFSTFGRSWEKTIEGMKVGGIRQVILTASYLSRTPLDYVIVLTALRPQTES